MNRRDAYVGMLAGLVDAGMTDHSAHAGEAVAEADVSKVILAWLDALRTGDSAVVAKLLAPEFQIQRADGTGFDATEYLFHLPKPSSKPKIIKLAYSSHEDMLVARYVLEVDQTIEGKAVQKTAPRLSVFRRTASGWLIAAHANFAAIG